MSAQQIFGTKKDLEESDALRLVNKKKQEKFEGYVKKGSDNFTANCLAWRDLFDETLEAF